MLERLPDKPDVAHALIRQKLNEHTEALREVKEENEKQNEKLKDIASKIDRVEANTASLVRLFRAGDGAMTTAKWLGKFIAWLGGIATGIGAIWYAITSWPNQGG